MHHLAEDLGLPELEIGWELNHTSGVLCHCCMSGQSHSQVREMQAEMAKPPGTSTMNYPC